jgi:hypothetical protein
MTRAALHASWRIGLIVSQDPVQPYRQFARHHNLGYATVLLFVFEPLVGAPKIWI